MAWDSDLRQPMPACSQRRSRLLCCKIDVASAARAPVRAAVFAGQGDSVRGSCGSSGEQPALHSSAIVISKQIRQPVARPHPGSSGDVSGRASAPSTAWHHDQRQSWRTSGAALRRILSSGRPIRALLLPDLCSAVFRNSYSARHLLAVSDLFAGSLRPRYCAAGHCLCCPHGVCGKIDVQVV